MKSAVKKMPVRDAKGDELTLYEFQDWRYLTKVRRLKLCTGELVSVIDDDTFELVSSGERLTRIVPVA